MNKKYFIELTNDLYRLTFLFPKEEAIRFKLRELADEVLSDLIIILDEEDEERNKAALRVERNIKILESFLEIAKSQDWVEKEKIDEVGERYGVIKEEVENFNDYYKSSSFEKEPVVRDKEEEVEKKKIDLSSLNKRQKKIVDLLSKMEKVQVKDVEEVMKGVTKRTIRRDFDKLLKEEIAQRVGKGSTTYYKMMGQ